jgi:hypothetical protein
MGNALTCEPCAAAQVGAYPPTRLPARGRSPPTHPPAHPERDAAAAADARACRQGSDPALDAAAAKEAGAGAGTGALTLEALRDLEKTHGGHSARRRSHLHAPLHTDYG